MNRPRGLNVCPLKMPKMCSSIGWPAVLPTTILVIAAWTAPTLAFPGSATAKADDEPWVAPAVQRRTVVGGGYVRAGGTRERFQDEDTEVYYVVAEAVPRTLATTEFRFHSTGTAVRSTSLVVDGNVDDISAAWAPAEREGEPGTIYVVDRARQTVSAHAVRWRPRKKPLTSRLLWRRSLSLPSAAVMCEPQIGHQLTVSCRLDHPDDRIHLYWERFEMLTGVSMQHLVLPDRIQGALSDSRGRQAVGWVTASDANGARIEGETLVIDAGISDIDVSNRAGELLLRYEPLPTKESFRLLADEVAPGMLLVWKYPFRGDATEDAFRMNLDERTAFAIYDIDTQAILASQNWATLGWPHDRPEWWPNGRCIDASE